MSPYRNFRVSGCEPVTNTVLWTIEQESRIFKGTIDDLTEASRRGPCLPHVVGRQCSDGETMIRTRPIISPYSGVSKSAVIWRSGEARWPITFRGEEKHDRLFWAHILRSSPTPVRMVRSPNVPSADGEDLIRPLLSLWMILLCEVRSIVSYICRGSSASHS